MTAISQPVPGAYPYIFRTFQVPDSTTHTITNPFEDNTSILITDADFSYGGDHGSGWMKWTWESTVHVIGEWPGDSGNEHYHHWDGFVLLPVGGGFGWSFAALSGSWTVSLVGWAFPDINGG